MICPWLIVAALLIWFLCGYAALSSLQRVRGAENPLGTKDTILILAQGPLGLIAQILIALRDKE